MAQAIPGLALIIRGNTVWLEMTASDETIAALNLSEVAKKQPKGIGKSALQLWCEDRLLETALARRQQRSSRF